jgi:hypothetical protein
MQWVEICAELILQVHAVEHARFLLDNFTEVSVLGQPPAAAHKIGTKPRRIRFLAGLIPRGVS